MTDENDGRKRATDTPFNNLENNECNDTDPDIGMHLEQLELQDDKKTKVLDTDGRMHER